MNWEMLSAVGQLTAVLVGIPSLIYLAVQIRGQTKERRQTAVNALTVQWGDLTKALHESGEFSALYLRGVQSFSDLDGVSKLRFSAFQNRFFHNFEGMYFSFCEGILTPPLWGEVERTMSDFLAYPGVRQWWTTRKHWYTEEFARVVDGIIARAMSQRCMQPITYQRPNQSMKPTAPSTPGAAHAGELRSADFE